MARWARERLTYANVMSTIAAFAAIGGGAFAVAAIPGKDGKITGCFDKKKGTLRVINAEKKKKCAKSERTLVWNQTGPPGSAGAQGDQGNKGDQGVPGTARAYGTVRGNCPAGVCELSKSKGITRVTRTSEGSYCVEAPGIDADATPAAASVVSGTNWVPFPAGNAAVDVLNSSVSPPCGPDDFRVHTEFQPQTAVRNSADNGSINVSGLADLSNDVAFTIVIP